MMTDREKLIELLNNVPADFAGNIGVGAIADHILADGWIRLPCKVGDTIYRCAFERNEVWEWDIALINIYADEIIYIDDSENTFTEEDIGKTVFLSREDAEKALEERKDK